MPETDGAIEQYTLRFALPGASKEDIMVAFAGGCLEVYSRALSERAQDTEGRHYYEKEEVVTHQRLPLPEDADTERARVTLVDGQALIEIPRRGRTPG